ncbi:MAG: hypothetical protein OQJ97_10040 [Rhodospirillales bacterium]|nr:hypothetical protein [Rhodospirillales bacterium]
MENHNRLVSYLTLRKAVGYLGLSLPLTLAIGALIIFKEETIRGSISAYYYSDMRDVFVGTMCALALVLFSYKGYEKKDDIAGDLACLFAVGIAVFPTSPAESATLFQTIIGYIHLTCAGLFFMILAYFSYCLFTKTDPTKPLTPQAKLRIQIYKFCGLTIIASILLIVVITVFFRSFEEFFVSYKFWLESVAIFAFSFSWLIKGKSFLADQE